MIKDVFAVPDLSPEASTADNQIVKDMLATTDLIRACTAKVPTFHSTPRYIEGEASAVTSEWTAFESNIFDYHPQPSATFLLAVYPSILGCVYQLPSTVYSVALPKPNAIWYITI